MHNIPHHITTYHMFHAISRTFNVATHLTSDHRILHLTSHNTAVCLPPPFHTTTSQSTCSTSTSHTIPYTRLFHTTPTFSIVAYFTHHHTPHALHHHIWHHKTLNHFPHLTSHNNRTAHCISHILHHHNSTPPQSHDVIFHLCNIPHTLHYATFHITGHHIPHHAILHILHFNYTMSENIHSGPHFAKIAPRHPISAHSTSCPHFTPCTSHSNINFTSHYPIAPHIPHCISTIIPHHTAMSNMAPSNHSTSLGIPQPHFASSQHATILHMYHTIVPHRITTFRIWHCMT